MTFENAITIQAPPKDVFDYLAHFENIPKWNYAISQVVQTSSGPVGVGSVFKQFRTIPKPSEEVTSIAAFEPPSLLVIEGQFGLFAGTTSYALSSTAEGGTKLVNTVSLKASGMLRPLGGLIGPRVQHAVAQNLDVLKKLLEGGDAN